MYYKLKNEVLLRGWEQLPHCVYIKTINNICILNKIYFNILLLCDGKTDVDSLYILDNQRKIIKNFEKLGIIEQCEKNDTITEKQKYKLYPCRYIKQAHWSITGKCNYLCKHCYLSAPGAKFGELSHEVCMDIIDQLAECGIMNVSLTGGEPLVRNDFMEIVDALLSKDININQIYSNGALVNENLLNELEKRGIKPQFSISFDGIGWHDWLRGIDGAEEKAINAFKLLKKHGFSIDVEMCLHKNNMHTLEDTVNLLSELGVESLKTNPVQETGDWTNENGKYNLTTEELYDIYLDYIPKFLRAGSPLNLHLGGFFLCNKGKKDYIIPSVRFDNTEKTCSHALCGHARNVMYIAPDGQLLPCIPLAGHNINGKKTFVTDMPLREALSHSDYLSIIETKISTLFEKNKKCSSCEYKYQCGGGCRAQALLYSNDYFGCDNAACTIFHNGYIDKIREAVSKAL